MADMNLTDAIQDLIDNVEIVFQTGMNYIQSRAKMDWDDAAKYAIDKYYSFPQSSYHRQHNLYNAYDLDVGKTSKMKKGSTTCMVTAIVNFDDAKLDGLYKSSSKRHQGGGAWGAGGQVEGSYVMENFLADIHPWTSPKPYLDDYLELKWAYKERKGSGMSPDKILKKYQKNYPKIAEDYFNQYVLQRLKGYIG